MGKGRSVQVIREAPVHPFDREFGTDTGGLIPGLALATGHANDAFVTAYYAVAPSILEGLIDLWQQTDPPCGIDRYTFVDVGAGKGRAMLCAAQHPFAEVVGLELNPRLAATARANVAKFAGREEALSPVRIIEGDALEAVLPDGPVVVFLFHPFEAPMVRRFVKLLELRDSDVDVLYVNAEHTAILDHNAAWTRRFNGMVPMNAEDHLADLAEIAGQREYGSTGDEFCTIYRMVQVPE